MRRRTHACIHSPIIVCTMIEILTQTEHYVVVNKPAGMLVHRLGQLVYPVHRLDRPTSGAMLWALNSEAARWFMQQFEQKQIRKHYLAIVRGWTENAGCLVCRRICYDAN